MRLSTPPKLPKINYCSGLLLDFDQIEFSASVCGCVCVLMSGVESVHRKMCLFLICRIDLIFRTVCRCMQRVK